MLICRCYLHYDDTRLVENLQNFPSNGQNGMQNDFIVIHRPFSSSNTRLEDYFEILK